MTRTMNPIKRRPELDTEPIVRQRRRFHPIVQHILFAALVAAQFLPGIETRVSDSPIHTLVVAFAAEIIAILCDVLTKKNSQRRLFGDVFTVIFGFLLFWTLATAKLPLLSKAKSAIFPPPGAVFKTFAKDFPITIVNIRDSFALILQGYFIGVGLAVPLGLALGAHARSAVASGYIAKFLSSISPIVYIPYAIVLLPTFRAASVFIIVVAAFWPTLAGTMSGVLNVDRRIMDAAKMLEVKRLTLLFGVILPASLPEIFIGTNQGLGVAFILLTSAEMIGARSGMGYYVNNNANFGNYTSALSGVLTIGVVITTITFAVNALQRRLLRWKQ